MSELAALIRVAVAKALIHIAMAILPSNTRRLVRNILLYHVPGALTEDEKREVVEAKYS
jgi:hypothetical protein